MMTENYKILSEFIKDISAETPDIESYLFVIFLFPCDAKILATT